MMLNYHPAPGLSDLLPGWFVVPQNPFKPGTLYGPITRTPSIGDLLPGHFVVPQNPLLKGLGLQGCTGGCAGGCGCGGTCGGGNGCAGSCGGGMSGVEGLGGFLDDIGNSVSGLFSGIQSSPNALLYGIGGLALLWMLFHPGHVRAERQASLAQAKASYLRRKAQIKRGYSVRAGLHKKLQAQGVL